MSTIQICAPTGRPGRILRELLGHAHPLTKLLRDDMSDRVPRRTYKRYRPLAGSVV